jgi:putative effector of murein hydrolase
VDYADYNEGAQYISYLLTPATVCLAIPLYKQLALLRQNLLAVVIAIAAGVAASAVSIFLLCLLFRMEHVYYVTLLPKSITTAIGMGVSEEAGGIVTITVVCIIVTGILGNIIGETVFRFLHLENPIARGLALGTSAHAVGTAKALELGEIEGAMSSLSVAVAGLMTVVVVPLVSNWI